MKLFLLVFTLLSLSFLGIAVKILLKKNGKMAGTCASQNPFLNKESKDCSYCGKSPELCKNKK